MKSVTEILRECGVVVISGNTKTIVTDLDSDIPLCKVCGINESTVTVTRWHNNLRVESDECLSCSVMPLSFEKENDCKSDYSDLLSKKGIN
jgi:hypothetical protein